MLDRDSVRHFNFTAYQGGEPPLILALRQTAGWPWPTSPCRPPVTTTTTLRFRRLPEAWMLRRDYLEPRGERPHKRRPRGAARAMEDDERPPGTATHQAGCCSHRSRSWRWWNRPCRRVVASTGQQAAGPRSMRVPGYLRKRLGTWSHTHLCHAAITPNESRKSVRPSGVDLCAASTC